MRKSIDESVNEHDIYEELFYWADKNGYVERDIACIVTIPKEEKRSVIKYLKSQFPKADTKLISNIVKEYEV